MIWPYWNFIDLGFDLAFMIDITLKFFTAIEFQGNITYEVKLVAGDYIRYSS